MPMPRMEKAPPELVSRFRTTLAQHPVATVRTMFGYPAAFVGGNMATGLFAGDWFVRLPEDARTALLARGDARAFEPMPGRPMRDYVVLPQGVVDDADSLAAWVERSIAHTGSLPPKPGTARR